MILAPKTWLTLAALAVGTVAVVVVYRKASATATAIVDTTTQAAWAVTPWNNDNIIYGGVNSVGAAVTGDTSFSLGSWIYDITHPEPTPIQSGGGGIFNGNGASGGW